MRVLKEISGMDLLPAPIVPQLGEQIPGSSTKKIIALARQSGLLISFGLIELDGNQYYCTHVSVNGVRLFGKSIIAESIQDASAFINQG